MPTLAESHEEPNVALFDQEGNNLLFQIDATVSENHALSSKATMHEIEDGSVISDHIINKGRKLTLEGIVSDDPFLLAETGLITAFGLVSNVFEGLSGAIVAGGGAAIAGAIFSESKPRSKTALDIFDEIYEKKQTVQIVTGLKSYKNMVLENLSIPRTAQNSKSLTFKATFVNIILAQFSESIAIGPDDTLLGNAVPKTSEGTKPVEEVSEAVNEEVGSVLSDFKLAITGSR
jgi:hypothetical protein